MISEKRKNLNLTQEQMAKELGISVRHYVRIDKEETFPRRDILRDLIRTMKLTDVEIGQYVKILVSKEPKQE